LKNLLHIVLISFKAEVSEKARENVYNRLQTLAEDCGGKKAGILFWKVGHNLDLRKNIHLVEIAIFENDSAIQAFKRHPNHQKIGEILSKVADWKIGDIYC